MAQDTYQTNDPYGSTPDAAANNDAIDPYADKKSAVKQWYQQYLGRAPENDQVLNSWATNANFGNVQNWIQNSPEAQAYAKQQAAAAAQPAAQPAATAPGPFDPRNALSSVFQKYGLDPNNPGHGLANIDYFLQRGGETGGGWGNSSNQQYWAGDNGRTAQEIEQALYGKVGNLLDPNWGKDTGQPASAASNVSLQSTMDPQTAVLRDQLFNELQQRAGQSLNIDRNDPIIRSQADAYSANTERARRNYLADLAESSGPISNLTSEQRLTAEQAGQANGAFESELMGRELQARRDEIAQALQQQGSLLTGQQQLSLQAQLASLDNAIKEQQLGLQSKQMDLTNELNYRQLGQQNDQFLRQLGLQDAQQSSYWDAVRSGLING